MESESSLSEVYKRAKQVGLTLLAIAAVLYCASREEAAKIGVIYLQTLRHCVILFN